MKILVSNDDGYLAEGINCLAMALKGIASIRVVAPDRNRSGASNSLTLDAPLRVQKPARDVYSLNGTPSDCVHLALTGMFDDDPDMVVSGINHGANLGDDVIYSGTVAAAMEGRFLGIPALAVSLVGEQPANFATAARVVLDVVERLRSHPLPGESILNINVPDVAYSDLKGYAITRLGFRHRAEPSIEELDPRQRQIFWIGMAGAGADAGPGTDFHAISNSQVSITPLTVDLTRHEALDEMRGWLAR